MHQQKILAVQQCPHQILSRFVFLVAVGGEELDAELEFGGVGAASDRPEVQLCDELVIGEFLSKDRCRTGSRIYGALRR